MTGLDLAIIVVTHNSARVIRRCLDAMGAVLREHLLIVDNGSSDGTVSAIESRYARVLVSGTNEGFGRAANRGARAADAEYLCFLNPDCEADAGVFAAAEQALRLRPRCAIVPTFDEGGGRIVDGRQPGYTRLKLIDDMLRSNYGDPLPCRWLRMRPGYQDTTWWWPHGACLFIGRRLFLDLDGFDDRLFLYMEDVDLGRRLHERGGEIVQLSARVRHGQGHGADVDRRQRLRLLNAGRVRYAELRYGRRFSRLLASLALPSQAIRNIRGDWR